MVAFKGRSSGRVLQRGRQNLLPQTAKVAAQRQEMERSFAAQDLLCGAAISACAGGKIRSVKKPIVRGKSGSFFRGFRGEKTKKNTFFKKQTREVIENKRSVQKTNPNKPKNEAEKLLKIRTCGKNKPKNEPGHVVGNTGGPGEFLHRTQSSARPTETLIETFCHAFHG